MAELTLAQQLRCTTVTRWHIVRTMRQQTVADHQWATYTIACALQQELKYDLSDRYQLLFLQWALFHDVPEVIVGDLPSPTSAALNHHLTMLIRDTSDTWAFLNNWANTFDSGVPATIVKLAELLTDWQFLRQEGVGTHAEQVTASLSKRITDKTTEAMTKHPRFEWITVTLKIMGLLT